MTIIWFMFLITCLFTLPLNKNNTNRKTYDEERYSRSSYLSSDVKEGDKRYQEVKPQIISIGEVCPKTEGKKNGIR